MKNNSEIYELLYDLRIDAERNLTYLENNPVKNININDMLKDRFQTKVDLLELILELISD